MTNSIDQEEHENVEFVAASDIGSRAKQAAVWSAIQIILRNALSICVTASLARLLDREDYGLLGMVATLTALLQVFADMGLSWATVQRQNLKRSQVVGLFWVNVLAGALLWLAMILASSSLAAFYNEPKLQLIAIASGAGFLLSGLAVQPMALLVRDLNFRLIAKIEISSLAIGAIVALTLAIAGAGYWALVAQMLSQAIFRAWFSIASSSLHITAPRWTPGLGGLLGFGGLLALNGVLIYFARNLDSVLIGRTWGAAELGVYNRAYFLMLFPSMLANGVLSGLMVSSLSNIQSDAVRFGNAYRRALRIVAYVGTPLAIGLALTASSAVRLVYGPEWHGVVPILSWLSLAGATQAVYNTNGWLFTASGRGWPLLTVSVINLILLSTTFFLTVPYGAVYVAQGYGITMGLIIPVPAMWLAHHVAGIPILPSFRSILPVVAMNSAMGLTVWLAGWIAQYATLPWQTIFISQVLLGVVVYATLTPILLPNMVQQDIKPLFRKWIRSN